VRVEDILLIRTNLMVAILIVATVGGLVTPVAAQMTAQPPTHPPPWNLARQVNRPLRARSSQMPTVAILVSGGPTAFGHHRQNRQLRNETLRRQVTRSRQMPRGFHFVQDDVEVAAGQSAQFNIALEST